MFKVHQVRLGLATNSSSSHASGVPDWCYETKEGAFSVYVDAVAKKTGRASYGSSLTMRPLKSATQNVRVSFGGHQPSLSDELKEHFAAY